MSIRVLLVEDQKILLDLLCSQLEKSAEIQVVGVAGDGQSAVQKALEFLPDVVIMDIGLPDPNFDGIEATRRLKVKAPEVKVVALSFHADKYHVLGMLQAGASGYLVKDDISDLDELLRAVSTVAAGERYLSPSISGVVLD